MNNIADVVIIGGGIAGVSALYHLTQAGIKNVLLLEMNTIGSGTTRYSAAFVAIQEPDKLLTRFSQISFPDYFCFKDKFGIDIGYYNEGSLSINISDNEKAVLERCEFQERLSIPTKIFSADVIKSMAPFLNTDDLGSGVYCEYGGSIDVHAFMHAYIKIARESGAEVFEGVRVTGITVLNNKVVGVQTSAGYISTNIVVNAAGIYAKRIASMAGISLPLINSRRYTAITETADFLPKSIPCIEIIQPFEIYISVKKNSVDFTFGSDETSDYSHSADPTAIIDKYSEQLAHRMPRVMSLRLRNFVSGIRSLTPDGLPILGSVDSLTGYYNDCGWGGNGVSLAPGGGKLIADAILGSQSTPIEIAPFLYNRYKLCPVT